MLAAADFSELVSLEVESGTDSAALSVVVTLVGAVLLAAVLLVTPGAAALAVLAVVILATEVGMGILAELAGVVE
ncbi:hypothetical protein IYO1511_c27150 [Lactiplantibacillus plantarum]|nr:hypothetical protein AWA2045_26440 [Lactiplantibacillus plantarum]BEI65230.1 hypothetical protein IYO1511_c27150 [Lactiplantibacillus plantarum]GIP78094.1 hypothetical protein ITOLOC_20890 [Lactiplantibacillus plantarum]CDN29792.1 hypothetical protein predicted by Glimmer/Critica [Lactiplantibacillus plantarum]